MNPPSLPAKQYAVISLLSRDQWVRAKSIRGALPRLGYKGGSLPGFYQLMSRMESGKYLKSRYVIETPEEADSGKQTIRECEYQLTAAGEKAFEQTLEFYIQIGLRES